MKHRIYSLRVYESIESDTAQHSAPVRSGGDSTARKARLKTLHHSTALSLEPKYERRNEGKMKPKMKQERKRYTT